MYFNKKICKKKYLLGHVLGSGEGGRGFVSAGLRERAVMIAIKLGGGGIHGLVNLSIMRGLEHVGRGHHILVEGGGGLVRMTKRWGNRINTIPFII